MTPDRPNAEGETAGYVQAWVDRQGQRDEDLLTRLGMLDPTAVKRSRALAVLGLDEDHDPTTVQYLAARLRGQVRRGDGLSPEDMERLLAAETLNGENTEVSRAVLEFAERHGIAFDL